MSQIGPWIDPINFIAPTLPQSAHLTSQQLSRQAAARWAQLDAVARVRTVKPPRRKRARLLVARLTERLHPGAVPMRSVDQTTAPVAPKC
jgi:hypothetical protein